MDTNETLVLLQDKGVERVARLHIVSEPDGERVSKVSTVDIGIVLRDYNMHRKAADRRLAETKRLAAALLEADLVIEAVRETAADGEYTAAAARQRLAKIRDLVAPPPDEED